MWRQVALRVLGILVALAVLAVAAQYLVLAVSDQALLPRDDVRATARWVARSHGDGTEILVGIGLVLVGLLLAWAFVSTIGASRRVITTRRANGWTRVDRASLAPSIQRVVDPEFPRDDVAVRLARRRQVGAVVRTDDVHPNEVVAAVQAEIERTIESRALPLQAGRVESRRLHRQPSRVQ